MYELKICDSNNKPITLGHSIKSLKKIYKISEPIRALDREHILIVSVGLGYKFISADIVNIGNVGESLVNVREVFRILLNNQARGVYMIHNHPSGTLKPSLEDKTCYHNFIMLSRFFDITVLDSIVVSPKGAKSIRTKKEYRPKNK